MRILVTGGAGFIGRHLVHALLLAGHDVTSLDPAGPDDDVNIAVPVEEYRPQAGDNWEVIYHLASPVGTYGVVMDSGSVATHILAATSAVLDLAIIHGAKLVNVSTSEVYGHEGVTAETTPCVFPPRHSARLAYAAGKLAAEMDVHTSGVEARTIRPFNVAGPGQKASTGFVIPRWCQAALTGTPLTVFDPGLRRAFCHVHDFVGGLLMYLDDATWEYAPDVVNLGNPDNHTTIGMLAFAVARLASVELNRTVDVERISGEQVFGLEWEEAAGQSKLPDISVARELGWLPTLSLDAIIRDTLTSERASFGRRLQ